MRGMRRLGAIVSVVLLAAAVLLWSCGGRAPKSAVAVGQVIEIDDEMVQRGGTDTVCFGRLHEGEIAVRSVTFRNTTAAPTVIVSHERSCGCIDVEYERRPIMPGEESKVDFTFDSRGEYGWQLKLITLRIGAAAVPLKIYVEAEVEW